MNLLVKFAAPAAMVFASTAGTASAALVNYSLQADVNFLISPSGRPAGYENVGSGDRFYVDFTLDTGVPDGHPFNWWGIYADALKNVTLSVPSRGINASYGNGTINVFNGTTVHQTDEIRCDIPIDNLGTTFIFWLRANSPDGVNGPSMLTNDVLPAQIDPTQWNFTRTIGLYHNAGQGGAGNYSIFTGNASLVPEPAVLTLAAWALPLLARRRRA